MTSCIIIAPTALIPAADSFAEAVGFPQGQLTAAWDEGHMACHFTPSDSALAILDGTLPDWLQVIDCDADPVAWDTAKVGVFLSASMAGWVHGDAVRAWPQA